MNKNQKPTLNPYVFYPSSLIIFILLAYATIFPKDANQFFKNLQNYIVGNGDWFYVLSVAIILLFVAYLALSKFGEIKLGLDHSEPDYTNKTWFAMLFSAGMGIGLMFFGVAEPVMHFLNPPIGDGSTVEAARAALKITLFHWGFHGWAIYALVAIMLAFFAYRHNLPLTLRSSLYPLIGDKIYGPIGHSIDIFAIIGTLFGVATSMGFGVLQINSGLNYIWGIEISTNTQILLVIFVTILSAVSVTSGLDKGIKRLSEANMIMAVLLLLFVLFLGDTVFLLQALIQNTGTYLSDILRSTFNLYAYQKTDWIGGWTVLYWAWWISWSPFVGLFIARISKGRTIREFIVGVLFVPTGFIIVWMTVFGNSAINFILNKGMVQLGEVVSKDVSVALYEFLSNFAFSSTLSVVATIMVIIFFVTSADSGAMVINMLCSDGKDDTPLWQRIYWALGEGIIAAVLLLAGGLGALQTMTIASALPFTVVLLVASYGLLKALRIDLAKKESLAFSAIQTSYTNKAASWKERLNNIVTYPNKNNVQKFISATVKPAFNEIIEELKQKDYKSSLMEEEDKNKIGIKIDLGEEKDFIYKVILTSSVKPHFVTDDDKDDISEEELYFRAEVYLIEGGQRYDVMGWSKEGIINDIIDQFHKHTHFIHSLN